MKVYNIQYGIGRAKYVLNYHDGIKKHSDGSPFFDIKIFKNKDKLTRYISGLASLGYRAA